MKDKRRFINSHRSINNRGFSLMELLVSIIILILIMVPLMNNFVRSVKINDEADKLQDYSIIASNIVEDIKSLDSKGILSKYGTDGLIYNGLTYSEHNYTVDDTDKDVYYYGFDKEASNGTKYDVLVTVNANTYKKGLTPTPGVTAAPGMNDYEMPDIATVDDKLNGMFFSDVFLSEADKMPMLTTDGLKTLYDDTLASSVTGNKIKYQSLDRITLNYFLSLANDYADQQFKENSSVYASYLQAEHEYEEAKKNGITPPAEPVEPSRFVDVNYADPPYCRISNLLKWITRTNDIDIADTGKKISYRVTYQCQWEGASLTNIKSYDIRTNNYSTKINNVYLYYQPSIFQQYYLDYNLTTGVTHKDNININNEAANTVNFYMVKMSSGITAYVNSTEVGSNIQLDTNLIKYYTVLAAAPDPSVGIYKKSNNLNIYTNLLNIDEYDKDGNLLIDEDINKGKIVSSVVENRIYSIKVQIFEYSDTNKYKTKELYTLDSNREN